MNDLLDYGAQDERAAEAVALFCFHRSLHAGGVLAATLNDAVGLPSRFYLPSGEPVEA
jgi:hypothetical protein